MPPKYMHIHTPIARSPCMNCKPSNCSGMSADVGQLLRAGRTARACRKAFLATIYIAAASAEGAELVPAVVVGTWLRPAAADPAEPRWGFADGLQVDIHPLGGLAICCAPTHLILITRAIDSSTSSRSNRSSPGRRSAAFSNSS